MRTIEYSEADLEKRIEELKPWRYNHAHQRVVIRSDSAAAKVHDAYGRKLLTRVVSELLQGKCPETIRALDMGCLEGHYSDILCGLNLREVVAIDLSEGHVKRATFLLKELKKYPNATVLQGNISDEALMGSLGKFNIVLFHGLLYHLKDPLRIFDILERLIPDDGFFFLLLSTQYKMSYSTVVSPYPVAELQVKPLKSSGNGVLFSPTDGSTFERCSLRLNPAALFQILKVYGYHGLVAYDDPGGVKSSYNSNLVVTKKPLADLSDQLNETIAMHGVSFYEWDGQSVNSYDFRRSPRVKISRFLTKVQRRILG